MISKRDILNIFPTTLGTILIEDNELLKNVNSSIIKYYDGIDCDFNHMYIGTDGIWTTPDDLHTKEEFVCLKDVIDGEVKIFLKEIYTMDPSDCVMTGMWCNIHKSGTKHHIHRHPNSFLSGVVYTDVPKNAGSIFFVKPDQSDFKADYANPNSVLAEQWKIDPVKGMLLLFPSNLYHGTEPGIMDEGDMRICFSFNYFLLKSSQNTMRYNFKDIK